MKITIIQGAFLPVPPELGGAVEKMWFALGKEFISSGHEVVHISKLHESFPKEELIDGVLHKRVKGYGTPSNGLVLKFLDLLYTIRVLFKALPDDSDIIVTNTFFAPILLSKRNKKICMVDVQRMPKGQMKFYKNVFRLRANSSSVSLAIKEEIAPEYYKKIVTIPNPLPFHNIPVIDFDNKKPVLLYAGRIHPEKGIDILIKAFLQLKTKWTLRILGPYAVQAGGGGDDYLQELKKLAGNHESVDFVGPIYNMEKLNAYYEEASIFIYPSVAEKGETFGLAPLEAMAWGCAPVVSNLACFRDFIVDGHNGLVFDHRSADAIFLLKDCIEILQDNPVKREQLAVAALEVRQSHSSATLAKDFLKEFQKAKNDL